MTTESFGRQPGSVWARRIYDLLPDVHAYCSGESCVGDANKNMHWRPPTENEQSHTWFRYDTYICWLHGHPTVPRPDHDFSRGPEYPSNLPGN